MANWPGIDGSPDVLFDVEGMSMAKERPEPVASLDRVLRERTREGELYEKLPDKKVRCYACGHRCLIPQGLDGICRVRFNQGGTLYVPHGYVAGLQVDPIEKKPFFHAFPGSVALSFGMLGCDYHCAYCQNWLTSQVLRDPVAIAPPEDVNAKEIVKIAQSRKAPVMVSTYNEPLITSEWAMEVFREARAAGITCGYVSNGNGTPEVLRFIRPCVDLYKVDLKSFRDKSYRQLGGTLASVMATIADLHQLGFWVEIVTLIIPGFNDSPEELHEMAQFLVQVSPDIPWHCTAFHKNYKMTDPVNTQADALVRACEIGQEAGLRYCYAGNLPGQVGAWEDTRCPGCRTTLISRYGYHIRDFRLTDAGTCPDCAAPIAGFWKPGWKIPERDGGLPGRIPQALPLAPAADLPDSVRDASEQAAQERWRIRLTGAPRKL
jgi:pyruvate formate lyase activating enzyme